MRGWLITIEDRFGGLTGQYVETRLLTSEEITFEIQKGKYRCDCERSQMLARAVGKTIPRATCNDKLNRYIVTAVAMADGTLTLDTLTNCNGEQNA